MSAGPVPVHRIALLAGVLQRQLSVPELPVHWPGGAEHLHGGHVRRLLRAHLLARAKATAREAS